MLQLIDLPSRFQMPSQLPPPLTSPTVLRARTPVFPGEETSEPLLKPAVDSQQASAHQTHSKRALKTQHFALRPYRYFQTLFPNMFLFPDM